MRVRVCLTLLWALLAVTVLGGAPARAQQEILIGHVAGYTGPVTKDATELGAGAQVYIDSVNAKGGVLGKKLRIVVSDDTFKPDETIKRILDMNGKVSALLVPVGSANFDKVIKEGVPEKINTPIVGTVPGVDEWRVPLRKNVFHFRAGDNDQLEKIIDLTTSVGMKKISVLSTVSPNGDAVIAYMESSLAKRGLKLYEPQKYVIKRPPDFSAAIKGFLQSRPDVIVLVGPPFATAPFVKEAKSAGVGSALYGLSYTDNTLVAKTAGNDLARGVAIAQVFPNVNNRTMPLVKEFRENFDKFGKTPGTTPTYFNLEGYVGAKLIVEAIRRAKDASPAGVRKGLEMLRKYDLGGFEVDFSPEKHNGSGFVDLSIIGSNGKLIF